MPRKAAPHRVRIVRYVDAQGNRCLSSDPGARKVRTKSETLYGTVGGQLVSLTTADMGTAWETLQRLRREKAAPPDTRPDPATLSVAEHLQTFRTSLEQRDVSEAQTALVITRLKKLAALAKWKRLSDLTHDSLMAALAKLSKAGRSAQTRKHYLRHAVQFARWCCRPARRLLPSNPFEGIDAPNVALDRRHDRRCPSDAEVAKLFAELAKPDCPARGVTRTGRARGMTGPQRALAYKLAMATGLRAKEVRTLGREAFDLQTGVLTLRASADKRRRGATMPLPPWLVTELKTWLDAGGELWDRFPSKTPGRVLQADLAAAGVAYSVPGPDGPLFFDFHSLRVWYITQLVNQPGISPKVFMELARHSDAELAMKTYGKSKGIEAARQAVNRLPEPGKAGKPNK